MRSRESRGFHEHARTEPRLRTETLDGRLQSLGQGLPTRDMTVVRRTLGGPEP